VSSHAKTLVIAGALLFLLGLLQGAAVPGFANPRMALSAHLTALQSGMALMILGITWSMVGWSRTFEKLSFYTTIVGMYALWLGLTLAAASGASDALPIAGDGYRASRMIESTVSVLVMTASALMTIGWSVFLLGLIRSRN
jgi:(hydroxyamino)benzene mutase